VRLHLQSGAVLLGSPDITDYTTDTHHQRYAGETMMDRCLVYAQDAEGIAIDGDGTIDANGHREFFSDQRPMILRFLRCTGLALRDITIRNGASWATAFLVCRDIKVQGVTIDNRVNWNGDGLDFDSCEDVLVSQCCLKNSDDSICLQNSEPDLPCRNVVITNCTMETRFAGIRIGLHTRSVIENVTMSNCVISRADCSGLKIQLAEGGVIRRLLFSNIVMDQVTRPFLVTANQHRFGIDCPDPPPPPAYLGDLVIRDVVCHAPDNGGLEPLVTAGVIDGCPGYPIHNVVIDNLQLTVPGGGTAEDAARRPPELERNRPEGWVYAPALPCTGLFARHVRDLRVRDLSVRTRSPDARPETMFVDVE
jgi:hypothetical protein